MTVSGPHVGGGKAPVPGATSFVPNSSAEHWGTAAGLVASPGATSVRMWVTTPSGSASGRAPLVLTLKAVTPKGTWPAACVNPSFSASSAFGGGLLGKENVPSGPNGPISSSPQPSLASLQVIEM